MALGIPQAFAQKPFEGRIIYNVNYLGGSDSIVDLESALPQQLVAYISGTDLRKEQRTALAGQMIVIQSNHRDSIYHVFTLLDRRVLMADPLALHPKRYRVIDKSERKNLLGFKVSQKLLQGTDGLHSEAWVDEKHQNPFIADLPELKGLPLEFEMTQNGMHLRLTAIEVQEEPLDRTYFEYPRDAVRISDRMLQKILK